MKAKAKSKAKTEKGVAGRPSIYREELADRICAEMAEGLSLVDVCKAADMPHRNTVLRWMDKYPEFSARIRRVREGPQADHLFETMAEIENMVLEGKIDPQAARTVIWSRQWRAAKMAPKKYGDKNQVEISGDKANPVTILLESIQGTAFKPVAQIEDGDDE